MSLTPGWRRTTALFSESADSKRAVSRRSICCLEWRLLPPLRVTGLLAHQAERTGVGVGEYLGKVFDAEVVNQGTGQDIANVGSYD